MNNLELGNLVFKIIGWGIAFLVGIAIMRGVFSIGRIVELLKVIAQEIRARNLADGVDDTLDKLKVTRKAIEKLNQLRAMVYKQNIVEGPSGAA